MKRGVKTSTKSPWNKCAGGGGRRGRKAFKNPGEEGPGDKCANHDNGNGWTEPLKKKKHVKKKSGYRMISKNTKGKKRTTKRSCRLPRDKLKTRGILGQIPEVTQIGQGPEKDRNTELRNPENRAYTPKTEGVRGSEAVPEKDREKNGSPKEKRIRRTC